ncbi:MULTISPECIES: DUF554 domain-containing protein [Carboxydocella]|uniref:DUF554 domain-containing protein n=2 Tax=Carboxydocella TaxID=178898 RepID=A0A1T4RQR4_9FIRM|nr:MULTISPECIES: DUF554 domain-containing protein [Carboxydocella]AVX21892.1 hypothetical protein CFE_2760 [Carboxydocella thermautotrophica]AVX32295.1 hypothetical protein CTH_2771 [Carboxydocella thermautotrophica]SKA18227.1 hypothetical protein SAMN02745885_02219 [Carboxydocella sporoproducens DSM 16521]GAW28065.1 hypothetical protein ULO1_06350 [Carboxydocella sp. ULO1]GAW32533.1 hypothetical protein JDF658_22980 [Carboxydocella sp. JDF658]
MGTIINVLAIIAGTIIGIILGRSFKKDIADTIQQGLALAVLLIGAQMAAKETDTLIVIFALVIGGWLGSWLEIEEKLLAFGRWVENKMAAQGEGKVAAAFMTASLIYCVGAMAIMGSLEEGLTGKYDTLLAKSLLDGVSAIIFASTMGWGVALSALSVGVYQGAITLLAGWIKGFLSQAVINGMTVTGGLLIVGIAFNILGYKPIRVGNLLPAIPIAAILMLLK